MKSTFFMAINVFLSVGCCAIVLDEGVFGLCFGPYEFNFVLLKAKYM